MKILTIRRTQKHMPSSGKVTVEDNGIIICVLNGKATAPVVTETMRQTRKAIAQLRTQNKTPTLLLDVTNVYASDSEARSEAKALGTMGLERFAVVGANKRISLVGQYIVRASGLTAATRFFKTRAQARRWLLHYQVKTAAAENHASFYIPLFLAFLVAVTTLIGWQYDIAILQAIVPGLPAMNPVTALLVLYMVAALVVYKLATKKTYAKVLIASAAVVTIGFGMSVLSRTLLHIDPHIDTVFFQKIVEANNAIGRAKPLTAINFMLFGSMLVLVLSGQKRYWQKVLFHICSIWIFVSSVLVIVGYGFTLELFRHWAPMSLKTAIACIMINHALQHVAHQLPHFAKRLHATQVHWVAEVICVAVLTLTATMWQVSSNDTERKVANNTSSAFMSSERDIEARIRAYNDALRGYKAFFESSTFVDSQDFHSYFTQSELQQNYPGFITIAFVKNVPKTQESQYIKEMKAQAQLNPAYEKMRIYPATTQKTAYPITYLEPSVTPPVYGFDLGSEALRRHALEGARDGGQASVTPVINLNASRGASEPYRPGFFIAVPVYANTATLGTPKTTAERQKRVYGFVNAYFQNDLLFKDIFKDTNDTSLRFTITDVETNTKLYTHNANAKNIMNEVRSNDTIKVANRMWRIDMYTTPEFGAATATRILPTLILLSGLLVAALATALTIGQTKGREQALDLADDITEDLHKERNAAVAAQQRQEAILTSIGDAVFAVNTEHNIVLFNPAAEQISGYTADEAIGRPYREVLQFLLEGTEKEETAFIAKAQRGSISTMTTNTVLVTKRGKHVPVADSAAPIRDAKGEIVGVIVVFRDVTNERALEQSKDEFVSIASHQLRTPLSAMNWYSEMLLNGDAGKLTKDQKEYVDEIYIGNQRMIELVNSLLDTSRLDLGKLPVQPEKVNVGDLVDSIEAEMRAALDKKQLTVTIDIHKDIMQLYTDRKLLRMILQNLVSNAIKYTPEKGTISVMVRATTAYPDATYAHIEVTDTGYGIPEKQQAKIFTKMFRADNVLEIEGTGLGLYIVKEAVGKLGGRVSFVSKEQKGTTFIVEIPRDLSGSTKLN